MSHTMSERTFGVEIECFGPPERDVLAFFMRQESFKVNTDDTNNYYGARTNEHAKWTIKDDCSIRPAGRTPDGRILESMELTSPILKGKAGLKEVRTVCRLLVELGYKANRSCGLHVHVGISDLDGEEAYTVIKRYADNEEEINTLVAGNRRSANSEWCSSAKPVLAAIDETYKAFKDYEITRARTAVVCTTATPCGRLLHNTRTWGYDSCGTGGPSSRNRNLRPCGQPHSLNEVNNPFLDVETMMRQGGYHSRGRVNLGAYEKYGTVEFRQHHGSVDGTVIASWIRFLVNMVDVSVDLTEVKYGTEKRSARRKSDKCIFLGLPSRYRKHLREQARLLRTRRAPRRRRAA